MNDSTKQQKSSFHFNNKIKPRHVTTHHRFLSHFSLTLSHLHFPTTHFLSHTFSREKKIITAFHHRHHHYENHHHEHELALMRTFYNVTSSKFFSTSSQIPFPLRQIQTSPFTISLLASSNRGSIFRQCNRRRCKSCFRPRCCLFRYQSCCCYCRCYCFRCLSFY